MISVIVPIYDEQEGLGVMLAVVERLLVSTIFLKPAPRPEAVGA